jgi:sugar phosphate isomerase/epimerase
MRIGFLSRFDRERIDFARRHGFGCVELIAKPDDAFLPAQAGWQGRAADVKAAYAEAGLRISCIGGPWVNHLDADPGVAARHAEYMRHCMLLAVELGVGTVGAFAGRVMGQDLEASLPPFKRVWSEHARFAESHGLRIAFESCPMGAFHSPFGGNNCICTPAMWDRCFDAVPSPALGIEWDASHLVAQFIDPLANLRRYGDRVYHVHAKDAKIYRDVADRYGIYHTGAIEHCFPGLGDCDWGQIVKELLRSGYRGDLNIEGWHDAVYRDPPASAHPAAQGATPAAAKLEDQGLLISLRHLGQFVDGQ